MPTTNARKHVIPAGTEASVTRETIFEGFGNSIRDVVPVANTTERSQLVVDLTADGQAPSSTSPLVIYRHDAPGLHRIEYTIDGSVWLPASGTLRFTNDAARDSWTTANSGYLSTGDECYSANKLFVWSGSAWVADDTGWISLLSSLKTGWTVETGDTFDYKILRGKDLHFRGRLNATTGADGTSGSGILNTALPVEARPTQSYARHVPVTNAAIGATPPSFVTVVTPSGQLVVYKGANAISNLPMNALGPIALG